MGKLRVVATIEARMTSSRLPGKVLMPALDKPLLQILIERLSLSNQIDEIVVATTVNQSDNPIVELCKKMNIRYFRGSEDNVLERVCGAADFANADVIAEITGDCPLLDSNLIDDSIKYFLENYPKVGYVTNSGPQISLPWGMDVHVFMAKDLYEVNKDNPDQLEIENVSYRFYRPESGDKYRPYYMQYSGSLNRPELRIVLDYPEDYDLLKKAYEDLYPVNPTFTANELIEWVDKNKSLHDKVVRVREEVEPTVLEKEIYNNQVQN